MKRKSGQINLPFLNKRLAFIQYVTLLFLIISVISCQSEQTEGSNALMGRGYGISNTTLIVEDLDSARKYFTEILGFNIPDSEQINKGIFEGTVTNSIPFPDMSALVLLSLEDSALVSGKDSVVLDFLDRYKGVGMYSLSSSSVDSTYSLLTSRGFTMDSIRTHSFEIPGPQSSQWSDDQWKIFQVGFETNSLPNPLPEFEELSGFPYDQMHEWKSFYYMQREFLQHPNGVLGITAIKVVVEDLEAARKEFKKMGLLELKENPSENLVRFKIKRNQELHLISPQTPDDSFAQFLKMRGSGVFAIVFEVLDLKATYDLLSEKLPKEALLEDLLQNSVTVLKEYALGVQLEFVEEPEEQGMLAEQLKLNFGSKLDSTAILHAEGMYLKYCALCHGKNREGYAADFAPSLRSHSLLATAQSSNFLRYTIQYGRANTAMAGYYKEQGGPLEYIDVELMLKWLSESSGVEKPIELSRDPIKGDVQLGSRIYTEKCAACHGSNGEGISAPALGNPMLLATATDHFLRYAIAEGRDGTPMVAFKDSLSSDEIDAVTAFLRSRASGWNVPEPVSVSLPTPEEYVINPEGKQPNFQLREGLYLSAAQLNKALQDGMRLVLLDARSEVAWRQTHIPGAIPVPYYNEPETFVKDIPNDSTWIIAYCACPHAASGQVISKLKKYGFKNTAILDEGILVWAQLGYPVQIGN
ncbi:c-type cytochrome [Cognataquiflexum rubidum]|uniref:c-type cytochrome n=1 Tax=Cognataquiflexum rubidum TaxID=2922273 RepID=UPI001F131F48|nr:c-type cytochrome [Cognataquiflexum rubidum]MCH6235727.1 c-type cytochrome [Cognataquiflexum rubidum]